MPRRSTRALTVFALLLACSAVGPAALADVDLRDDDAVVRSLTAEQVVELLKMEGYGAPEIDDDGDVMFKIEGWTAYIIMSDEVDALLFYKGWVSDDVTLEAINEWNRSVRFSRAYLDNDDDPILEADLDLTDGVTVGRVKDWVATARNSMRDFLNDVVDP